MTTLILRRFGPEPALTLRRFGPDGRLAALAALPAPAPLLAVIGPPGAGAPDLSGAFAYGDATPDLLGSVTGYVPSVRIVIDTAFDGTGATVSIGTLADHELLFPVLDMNAADEASYEVACDHDFATATDIYIFITPGSGATAGAGRYWLNVI